MSYFIKIEGLADLEQQEKWEDVRELLYRTWTGDKLNSGKLIRLLSECWYLLSGWDCSINNEGLSFQVFQDTLIECTEFGLQKLGNDPRFLCVTGYMISILPHLFFQNDTNNLYAEWEKRGNDMLRKAHEIEPTDKVAKIFNLGQGAESDEYNNAKESIASELTTLFPGETYVEEYFIEMLSIKEI